MDETVNVSCIMINLNSLELGDLPRGKNGTAMKGGGRRRELTHVDTTKHIISNLAPIQQVLLEHPLVPLGIDLLQKEPLEVPKVLISSQTPSEDLGNGHVLDQPALHDHALALVLGIAFLMEANSLGSGPESPEREGMVHNVIVDVDAFVVFGCGEDVVAGVVLFEEELCFFGGCEGEVGDVDEARSFGGGDLEVLRFHHLCGGEGGDAGRGQVWELWAGNWESDK